MPDVLMPRLSDSMEEGTIATWLVADGATVRRGDEIVEIESDKATMSYAADADGQLRIGAEAGETLPLGARIARIVQEGESELDSAPSGSTPSSGQGEPVAVGVPGPTVDAAAADSQSGPAPVRPAASPVARRLAQAEGLDLGTIEGTGPRRRIVKADVLRAVALRDTATPAVAGTEAVTYREPTRIEQLVARRMVESRSQIPEFTVTTEIDLTEALAFRSALKVLRERGGDFTVPSVNDVIVKAVALVLREHRRVNSAWVDGQIAEFGQVNVGIAVSTDDGGLVVPVVPDADHLSLGALAERTKDLTTRARAGRGTPDEFSGGTFTVSNLGMFGVTSFGAVITPGQGAILSVGSALGRYVEIDGAPVLRKLLAVTLTSDHRVIYGAHAAAFLDRLRTLLEHPSGLAL